MKKIIIIALIIIVLYYLFEDSKEISNKQSKSNYSVREIPGFLTPEECDHIIYISEGKLEPSRVYKDSDVVEKESRVSDQCWFKDTDPVVTKISNLTRSLQPGNQEELQVVKYPTGGFFSPHYDACDGTPEFCKRMNGTLGPRYATVLIYLNDSFTGGETRFPLINKSIKPEKGKAVLFYNVFPNGNLITESLHGGDPITSGNKYVCNKWVRLN